MTPRRAMVSRWLATLLLLAAWFGATNHCALGLMRGAGGVRQHAGCCGQQSRMSGAPSKSAPVKECCAALQSTLLAPEKSLTAPLFLANGWPAAALWLSPFPVLLERSAIDPIETGPPRHAESFAELVLQRGLRSHAPPRPA
jgi:hypothetical protein